MLFRMGRVLVIIAHGYQEEVPSIVAYFRRSGVAVSLVGLTSGLISSLHGVETRPDCTLTQVDTVMGKQMLIIVGEVDCAETLLSDPRVYELINQVINTDGWVAALGSAQNLVYESLKSTWKKRPEKFLPQQDTNLADFLQSLIHRL